MLIARTCAVGKEFVARYLYIHKTHTYEYIYICIARERARGGETVLWFSRRISDCCSILPEFPEQLFIVIYLYGYYIHIHTYIHIYQMR